MKTVYLKHAGQISIAKFPNNGGLEKVGSNEYQMTTNSGDVEEGVPGGTLVQAQSLPVP